MNIGNGVEKIILHNFQLIQWVYPKTLCIYQTNTMGFQWVDTEATDA